MTKLALAGSHPALAVGNVIGSCLANLLGSMPLDLLGKRPLVLDRSARVYGLVMLGVSVLASWCGVFRLGRDARVARSMPFMYAGMSDAPKAPLDLAEIESPSFSLCLPKWFQPGIAPLGARIIRRLVPSIALFSL